MDICSRNSKPWSGSSLFCLLKPLPFKVKDFLLLLRWCKWSRRKWIIFGYFGDEHLWLRTAEKPNGMCRPMHSYVCLLELQRPIHNRGRYNPVTYEHRARCILLLYAVLHGMLKQRYPLVSVSPCQTEMISLTCYSPYGPPLESLMGKPHYKLCLWSL